LDIGDVGIQTLSLAQSQAGVAVIIAVCTELFAFEIGLILADGLHVFLCACDHRRQVLMILAAESLGMHDDLVFGIHQRLRVVPLDNPVGGGHLGRLVIGQVALDLFPALADLGLLFLQELVQAFHLALKPLLLLLSLLEFLPWQAIGVGCAH
jgi:hypothetical protein